MDGGDECEGEFDAQHLSHRRCTIRTLPISSGKQKLISFLLAHGMVQPITVYYGPTNRTLADAGTDPERDRAIAQYSKQKGEQGVGDTGWCDACPMRLCFAKETVSQGSATGNPGAVSGAHRVTHC